MWHILYLCAVGLLIFASFATLVAFTFLIPAIQAAPFMATDKKKMHHMLLHAALKPTDRVVDIGSGDGRIVLAAAAANCTAYGYEINPFLVWWSRRKAKKLQVKNRAIFLCKNFWDVDFSEFDVVFVFGIGYMMPKLARKLQKELRPGTRLISNGFHMPDWTYVAKDDEFFVYIVK